MSCNHSEEHWYPSPYGDGYGCRMCLWECTPGCDPQEYYKKWKRRDIVWEVFNEHKELFHQFNITDSEHLLFRVERRMKDMMETIGVGKKEYNNQDLERSLDELVKSLKMEKLKSMGYDQKALSWLDELCGSGQLVVDKVVDILCPPTTEELIGLLRSKETMLEQLSKNISLPPKGRMDYPKQKATCTKYWEDNKMKPDEDTQLDKSTFEHFQKNVFPNFNLDFESITQTCTGVPSEDEMKKIMDKWNTQFVGPEAGGSLFMAIPGVRLEPWGKSDSEMISWTMNKPIDMDYTQSLKIEQIEKLSPKTGDMLLFKVPIEHHTQKEYDLCRKFLNDNGFKDVALLMHTGDDYKIFMMDETEMEKFGWVRKQERGPKWL